MPSQVIVKPDKNLFLVYTWLTVWHLDKITRIKLLVGHPLRDKTAAHFQSYVSEGLDPGLNTTDNKIISKHRSALTGYALIHNAISNSTLKTGISLDSDELAWMKAAEPFLPHLTHFSEHTDFEAFYQSIQEGYQAECDLLQTLVDRVNFPSLLDVAWEEPFDYPMEIIPMPLEGMGSGCGLQIGGRYHQIIGPARGTFNKSSLYLMAHEGSHLRAKRVLEPIQQEIKQRSYLEEYARQRVSYKPNVYAWPMYFEEQFVDALQIACIDSKIRDVDPQPLDRKYTERKRLNWYEKWGKYFIRDFFAEIKPYKEKHTKFKNLAEVGLGILERLDKKYKK